jgi:hypothetical protein
VYSVLSHLTAHLTRVDLFQHVNLLISYKVIIKHLCDADCSIRTLALDFVDDAEGALAELALDFIVGQLGSSVCPSRYRTLFVHHCCDSNYLLLFNAIFHIRN